MVNVTNRADVAVRLRPFKLFLGHFNTFAAARGGLRVRRDWSG
jgi:hypothetical protein